MLDLPGSGRLRVLVVDDDEVDRSAIVRYLKARADVSEASNGEEARTYVESHPVDCVILDYNIPGTDTVSLLTEFTRRQTSVVMLTGVAPSEELLQETIDRGVQDFLEKGNVTADSLYRAVRFAHEHSRRLRAEQEIEAAAEVQRSLLPASGPLLPGYRIGGRSYPATRAGGDYFDFFSLPDGRLALVLADVSGHDLGATLLMVQLQAYLELVLESPSDDIAEVCERLNHLISRRITRSTDSTRYVTMFLVWLDPQTNSFVYAGAGHEAFLLNVSGKTRALPSTGAPLGMNHHPITASEPVGLSRGDLLFIPTDGISEARNHASEDFGKERMLQMVRETRSGEPEEIVEQLYFNVSEHTKGLPQADDITALIVKVD